MRALIRSRTGRAAGAVAAMLLLTPFQSSMAQESSAIAEGARVYGSTCGRCHNPRSPLERSDRDWVTIVNHMRVRANMTGEQVRNALAFLQATNTNPKETTALPGGEAAPAQPPIERPGGAAVSTDPAVIARGESLVRQRACLGCHKIGNEGGQVGPSLNGVIRRRSPDYIRKKLKNPTFDKQTSMMPNFGLSDEEVEAILAFLATLDGE